MWFRTVVFICVVSIYIVSGYDSQVFDVTTIYDIRDRNGHSTTDVTGRVHSRTNALGLPLYNGIDVPQKYVESNITCDSIKKYCTWTLKDWVLTPSSIPVYSFLIQQESFIDFQKYTKLRFQWMKDDEDLNANLYLTSEKTLSGYAGYHEIMISKEYGSFSFKHRICSTDIRNGQVIRQKLNYDTYSYEYMRCENYDKRLLTRSKFELGLENGKLFLLNNSLKVKEWTDYYNVKYLYVSGKYDKAMALGFRTESGASYVSRKEGSEMVSPAITLGDEKLCLALVFHVPSDSEESVMEIFSEDLTAEKHLLYTVNNVSAGWNVKHFNINFPRRKTGPMKLVVKKTKAGELKIVRVSRCSSDGSEVTILPPVKLSFDLLPRISNVETIYSATAYAIEPAKPQDQDVGKECVNGGVRTTAGCACPPGFYGSSCQAGCGKNRYGQDCRGLCSLRRDKACQGLLLCTRSTGCHCAPGYQGSTCAENCSDGYYGNNCQQKCGHCADGSACDIYTGECARCEFGYLPPYCNKESVYYPLPPQLSSTEYGVITVSFNHTTMFVANLRYPVLYQIQFREKDHEWKTYITKKYPDVVSLDKSNFTTERVVGLRDGVLYQVRVLQMDNDFIKYDGDLVKTSEITTKCDIPEEHNYKVVYESDSSSLNFSWTYVNTSLHWCPVEKYEVSWKEDWQWLNKYTDESEFSLTNLFSGSSIQFKVRAKTSGGLSPYSETVTASTQLTELSSVRSLKAKTGTSSSVEISWEPPLESEGQLLWYTVAYTCVVRPACSPGCQTASEGQQSVQDTRITLGFLLPFTQYMVTVTPEDGQPASVYAGTTDIVPTEVPNVSAQRPLRTNTSVTAFWDEVPVCSGFLLGYNYQLTKESESLKVLESGFTRNTTATFHNLTASTPYVVKVFVTTIAGWNPDSFLAISISTSATVPEMVRNVTVYKRGRDMLGLRWAEPRVIYGPLKSFTLTYSLGQEVTSHTVEPSHCAVWPDLYCHTIEGLRSNRRYNVTVSARNSEVPEDGEVAFVTAVTKESPPSAPANLKMTNISSTSIQLEWNYPEMANGIVRSFLIGVEETEKHDQDSCCQIYPFVETSVKEELKIYNSEVSGLHPASTYFVSVSAKTVGLGASQSLVVSTRPPHLPLTSLPRVQVPEISWLPQKTLPEVNNSEVYTTLVRAHLLLAVLNESQPIQVAPASGITDPKLDSLLQQEIGSPFYFIAEYNHDDEVQVSGPLEDTDSPWGRPPAFLAPVVRYQLVATQILEYNGVYNVDLRYSQPFILA